MTVIKYGLGTAQLGQIYGISSRKNIYSLSETKKLINIIHKFPNKIDLIDTAQLYGESEDLLGKVDTKSIKIITKISIDFNKGNIRNQIINKLNLSLLKLKKKKIYGLLIHNPPALNISSISELYDILLDLKENKIIGNFGLSIYDPSDLELYLKNYNFDIIQGPFNIIDQRLKNDGWFDEFQKRKIKFHARSIFLQGLLLLNKNQRNIYFNKFNAFWKEWDGFLNKYKVNAIDVCLNFILNEDKIHRIIVGVNSVSQMQYLIKMNIDKKNNNLNFNYTGNINIKLIDPRIWQLR